MTIFTRYIYNVKRSNLVSNFLSSIALLTPAERNQPYYSCTPVCKSKFSGSPCIGVLSYWTLFLFWPHSGNTPCLTPHKFPASNIRYWVVYSVFNAFFGCFLFFLFAHFLFLDLFLNNRVFAEGHNINLESFFHEWSPSHLHLFVLCFAKSELSFI